MLGIFVVVFRRGGIFTHHHVSCKLTKSYVISTEREAVLHSAHREEAPGAEEEA